MTLNILARNNVRVFGQGQQTLVFAHGFGCDQQMWRFVAPAFADDYRVVLFDYVGCGKSELGAYSAERYADLQGYAQDVLEICEALELTNAIFIGHSVSSTIGILAAIRAPERFAKLVLVGPSPRYINDLPSYLGGFERADIEGLLDLMDRNYLGWATFLAQTVVPSDARPELQREFEQSFCSTDPQIARRFAEATFFSDNRGDLAQLTVPALIMQCSEDQIAPETVGQFMHQQMPHSTLRVLTANGHCPQMSHPDETIAVIREYLSR